MPTGDSASAPRLRPRAVLSEAYDAYEPRVIPFAAHRRQAPETPAEPPRVPERQVPRAPRRRGAVPLDGRPRRARRDDGHWLERHALSLAAGSLALGVVGIAFGLFALLTRGAPAPSTTPVAAPPTVSQTAPPTAAAAAPAPAFSSLASGAATTPAAPPSASARREIQTSVRVLESNYTVQEGDTLGRIAVRFNTTVERLQALNGLADPRLLSIGQKLIVPPPL